MKGLDHIRAAVAVVLLIGLVGCGGEVSLETISEWKTERNISKLLNEFNSIHQGNRVAAIQAVADLKVAEAVTPLAALFDDPDRVVQHEAIDAVAKIGGPDAEKALLPVLGFKTTRARKTAAKAMGEWKVSEAVEPLIGLLNDDQESITCTAAISLGQIGSTKATKPLSAKLTERSFALKSACITSIKQIGGSQAAEALAPAIGDFSEDIRAAVAQAMIGLGDASVPFAMAGLKSDGEFTRPAAAAILKGLNKQPKVGADLVWYTLAKIPQDVKKPVDPALVAELAAIGGGVNPLLEAATHPTDKVREYASEALLTIGQPAAGTAVGAVESLAGAEGRKWFAERANWSGAPSWRLDLWGALVALNPKFNLNPVKAKRLANKDESARVLLGSKQFKPTMEYTPLLLSQTATVTKTKDTSRHANKNKLRAELKLRSLGKDIILPLVAGLNDADISIVGSCAAVLLHIDKEQAQPLIVEAFTRKVEYREEIIRSDFLKIVTELNDPEVEPLLKKIRPNDARAIKVFEDKYPGVHVSIVPMHFKIDPKIKAQPFRLKYLLEGKSKDLKVIFRPNEEGDWEPEPPLPEKLP